MITASLRASATLALLMPARLAIRIAQLFNCRTAFERLRQHDVGGLVERRAHRAVAELADPAGVVGLAGLMSLRGQPEMGSHLLRRFEPPGLSMALA